MAEVHLRRDPLDLEQLVGVLEVPVARAVGNRQLEVVVLALGAIGPRGVVRVPPVLDRVDDRVALDLLHADRGRGAAACGRRHPRIDVQPPLLVADAIGEGARAERHPRALERRQPLERSAARRDREERDLAILVQPVDVGVTQDLPDRLLDPRLRQVAREHAVAVGADHARLEAHREGELGDQDRQKRHHEDDGEQREAALVARRSQGAHGAVTRMETLTGACSAHRRREGDLDGAGDGALLGAVPALFPGAFGIAQIAEAHGGEGRIDDDRRHVLERVVVGHRLLADGQPRLVSLVHGQGHGGEGDRSGKRERRGHRHEGQPVGLALEEDLGLDPGGGGPEVSGRAAHREREERVQAAGVLLGLGALLPALPGANADAEAAEDDGQHGRDDGERQHQLEQGEALLSAPVHRDGVRVVPMPEPLLVPDDPGWFRPGVVGVPEPVAAPAAPHPGPWGCPCWSAGVVVVTGGGPADVGARSVASSTMWS